MAKWSGLVAHFTIHWIISICYISNIHVMVQLFSFSLTVHLRQENLQLFSMTTPIYIKQYFIMFLYISNHMIDAIFTCANPNTWPHTIIYQSIQKILANELLAYIKRCYFRKKQNENDFFDETKHISYQIVKRTSQVITIFQFVIFSTDIK